MVDQVMDITPLDVVRQLRAPRVFATGTAVVRRPNVVGRTGFAVMLRGVHARCLRVASGRRPTLPDGRCDPGRGCRGASAVGGRFQLKMEATSCCINCLRARPIPAILAWVRATSCRRGRYLAASEVKPACASNSHFARRVPWQDRHDRHDRRSAPRSAPDQVARRRRLAAQGEVRRQNENCWACAERLEGGIELG